VPCAGSFEIRRLPNITNIVYGRDVGYRITRINLEPEIEGDQRHANPIHFEHRIKTAERECNKVRPSRVVIVNFSGPNQLEANRQGFAPKV
jgi:hypothetical protein